MDCETWLSNSPINSVGEIAESPESDISCDVLGPEIDTFLDHMEPS